MIRDVSSSTGAQDHRAPSPSRFPSCTWHLICTRRFASNLASTASRQRNEAPRTKNPIVRLPSLHKFKMTKNIPQTEAWRAGTTAGPPQYPSTDFHNTYRKSVSLFTRRFSGQCPRFTGNQRHFLHDPRGNGSPEAVHAVGGGGGVAEAANTRIPPT